MKNPIDSIKSAFAKNKKPGDQMVRDVNKAHNVTVKRLEEKEKRQQQISDCAAVLRDCRFTFTKTIDVENALASEMRRKGHSTTKQRTRVRDCAIGIMVVDQALYELQSINSEADMNSAMNMMGMALRQLRRVDNSTTAISSSTERILTQWYPEGLTQSANAEEGVPSVEVDPEIRARINDTFIQNLMMGHSFDVCMAMSALDDTVEDPTSEQRDQIMADVTSAVSSNTSDTADTAGVIDLHMNKF